MKFEQLLQLYWSRGFLYGGKVSTFNVTLTEFFIEKRGLGLMARKKLIQRFELNDLIYEKDESLLSLSLDQRKIMNMYLSQIISINYGIFDAMRFNMIRLYLIKSFRGRCHAIGKPLRGQRTWSNASTAYRCNRAVRLFVRQIKKSNAPSKALSPKSKNLKLVRRKVKQKPVKIKMISTKKKKNLWF